MKALALVSAALLLAGCGAAPVREPAPGHARVVPRAAAITPSAPPAADQDGPPGAGEIPPALSDLPDAIPQAEGKSPYGNPDSYEVYGKRYEILADAHGFRERGYASWYGKKFHGKRTSSGEPYNMFAMTAAHKTLPIPAYARVTNLANGRSVVVRINDRGPFHDGRIVDLSYAAASKLDMLGHGSSLVDLEVLSADTPKTLVAQAHAAPAVVAAAPPPAAPVVAVPAASLREVSAPVAAATSTAEPAAKTAPAVAIPVAAAAASHYLQAGVFSDPVNAVAFRDKLAGAGIRPLLLKSDARDNAWTYRVLIGPFADGAALDAMRVKLNMAQTPTLLVTE